ncbi:DUF4883 family protein [Clostridium uliginosum]|uniref:Uncharacterized protein n=1 Tax=Clostridium uliginosum TaxID=119641 RepID=A0A1I1RTG5_9CLOT|nr:DUF4883 family protein [Clostridium uliginosum]SFD37377.1 DOmain of unknown function [Clostridium uliginosum]
MKKLSFISLIMLVYLLLNGCGLFSPKYINLSEKANNHYYTDELHKKILSNENFTLYVFDKNLYKEIKVNDDEISIIENFTNHLINTDYLDSTEESNLKEPFRIKIVFKDETFLIKVFNSKLVTLSPWDGNYKEDIISMDNLPLGYNLYDFCLHIHSKPIESNS